MTSDEKNYINSNDSRIGTSRKYPLTVIIIIAILICANFFLWSYLSPTVNNTLWYGDDALHISISNNLRTKGNFDSNYVFSDKFEGTVGNIIKDNPTIENAEGSWPPLYYIFLSSFYNLTNTSPLNLQFYASVFNFILDSFFITLFFLLIKKYFNLRIAFFSSLLITLSPFNGWIESHALPEPLMLIFSILALFFLERKYSHFILFGFFSGLAHLTHPIGILLPMSYALVLSINKEFKGMLFVLSAWFATISLWMIRDWYVFKDFGLGLYLPFSASISKIISQSAMMYTDYFPHAVYVSLSQPFQIFTNELLGTTSDLSHEFHMRYLLVFVIFLTGFAFLKYDNLKKFKILLLILCAFVILIGVIYYVGNSYEQIICGFILPIIVIYFLFKKKRSLFLHKIPRVNSLILIYAFLSCYAFYHVSVLLGGIASSKQIMLAIFLLVPISLITLEKIIPSHRVIGFFLILLILSPIMISYIPGIHDIVNAYSDEIAYPRDNNDTKSINQWLVSNAPKSANIASNYPPATNIRTGLNSIDIPSLTDPIQIQEFFNYYNISYLVFYDMPGHDEPIPLHVLKTYVKTALSNATVFSYNNSYVVNIQNLTYYEFPPPIIEQIKKLSGELHGNLQFSNSSISTYDNTKPSIVCDMLIKYKMFTMAIITCNQLDQQEIDSIPSNDIQVILNSFDSITSMYENKSPFPYSSTYVHDLLTKVFFQKAQILYKLQRYDDVDQTCLEVIRLDMFNKDAHELRAHALEKIGMENEAKKEYDFIKRIEASQK